MIVQTSYGREFSYKCPRPLWANDESGRSRIRPSTSAPFLKEALTIELVEGLMPKLLTGAQKEFVEP